LSFGFLGIRLTPERLEVDTLPFAPPFDQAEARLKVVVDLFEWTAIRVSLLVRTQIAEQTAAFCEPTMLAATVAVIEDTLDEGRLVHAPGTCKTEARDDGVILLRNRSGRC
jgi:hypothetical protein